ncbi:hypothetical protein GCM10022419_120390 [Nonomuraea rosea]|uniref:ABC transporter ATP-binding protein n=1 Tax=Nonomuraea rosea TaxID=638574 RepID=A0ABP6ZPB9_9ACTN
MLDLLVQLNREEGRTIAVVPHDLNPTCRHAHHLIAMRKGRIIAQGASMVVPIGRHLRF